MKIELRTFYFHGIPEREILSHPKVGSSWEGYAIEEILRVIRPEAAYFWATHTGAELDLLLLKSGRRYGVEVKFQDAPRMTPSMRIAITDLHLEHLTVLYPGDLPYDLDRRVTVIPVAQLASGKVDVVRNGHRARKTGLSASAASGRARARAPRGA
jgi:predicted AAA+ superfamily ATPase